MTKLREDALPILAYCGSSILMTVTNKYVLSGFGFRMNFLLLAAQSIACVLLLRYFSSIGLISHRAYNPVDARRWFPVSLGLVAMIYTGSKALQYMSIPLFTIFKNLTIILIAYGELVFLRGPRVTGLVLLSFILMILSSIIAGWSDISQGKILKEAGQEVGIIRSYAWMASNCLTTAAYALAMRGKIKDFGFKDFDTVYYNNLLSVPVMLVLSFLIELPEGYRLGQKYGFFSGYKGSEGTHSMAEFMWMWIAILVSSIASFAISYSSSWCVRVTSSTTYSMVGALNKLPIAILGMIIFSDPVTFGSVMGILIAFGAGLLYSYAKSAVPKVHSVPILPLTSNKDDLKTTLLLPSEKLNLKSSEKVNMNTAVGLNSIHRTPIPIQHSSSMETLLHQTSNVDSSNGVVLNSPTSPTISGAIERRVSQERYHSVMQKKGAHND